MLGNKLLEVDRNMVTVKEERDKTKTKRTETGKYFYDLSKATFSITVLGNMALAIKDGNFADSVVYGTVAGLLFSVGLFICGYKILNK